jgi:hypothetical protein
MTAELFVTVLWILLIFLVNWHFFFSKRTSAVRLPGNGGRVHSRERGQVCFYMQDGDDEGEIDRQIIQSSRREIIWRMR